MGKGHPCYVRFWISQYGQSTTVCWNYFLSIEPGTGLPPKWTLPGLTTGGEYFPFSQSSDSSKHLPKLYQGWFFGSICRFSVFWVLGRSLRSKWPCNPISMFFGPKRAAGGVVSVRRKWDTGAAARWTKTWFWKGTCITKSQLSVFTNGVFTFFFFQMLFLVYFGAVERGGVLFFVLYIVETWYIANPKDELRIFGGWNSRNWERHDQRPLHSGILWADSKYIYIHTYVQYEHICMYIYIYV